MIKSNLGLAVAILFWSGTVNADTIQETTDDYGPFGTLHIYKASDNLSHVVLFISGVGRWNLGVVDMARSLAELDSMVIGHQLE